MVLHANVDEVVNQLMAGNHVFSATTPVWDSEFGGDEWYELSANACISWKDYIFGRGTVKGHSSAAKTIKYKYCLSPSMVADLKIAAAIHGLYPAILSNARTHKRSNSLLTVAGRVNELAKLFSIILAKKRDTERARYVNFSDFTMEDLKYGIHVFTGRPEALKRGLKLLSHPIVQQNLSSRLQWSIWDVTKSSFIWGKSPESEQIATLTDMQFLMLLEHSKRSVTEFLKELNLPRSEMNLEVNAIATKFESDCLRGEVVRAFVDGRISSKEAAKRLGISQVRFVAALGDVQNSAMMIMLLLTGMRASETEYVFDGCLEEKYGYWFLKSKVVKGKPRSAPPVEGWLAVSLVRDAYRILSMLCRRVGGKHLFSPIHDAWKSKKGGAYSRLILNTKFNRWIARIDAEGLFEGHSFTVHQCRETLVAQLAAQEVGLAFISLQLKHVHSQLNSMPNLVTASYGQYRSQLLSSVSTRLAVAREDALVQVYGEDAKLAGPGADAQKVRIDSFFAGLGLFGEDRISYIKDMARRGVRLMPTSIGSCTKSFIAPDGERLPPCAGDYNCDPNCHSHVVTERSAHVIKLRRAHAVNELANESMKGYREVWSNLIAKFDHMIEAMAKKQVAV